MEIEEIEPLISHAPEALSLGAWAARTDPKSDTTSAGKANGHEPLETSLRRSNPLGGVCGAAPVGTHEGRAPTPSDRSALPSFFDAWGLIEFEVLWTDRDVRLVQERLDQLVQRRGRVQEGLDALEAMAKAIENDIVEKAVVQQALVAFDKVFDQAPPYLKKQFVKALIGQIRLSDLRVAIGLDGRPGSGLVGPEKREPASEMATQEAGSAGLRTGGDGGSKPLKSPFAPLFQTHQPDEIIHYFPSFALDWALTWGRITNGERVIEDSSANPELDCLPFPTASSAQNFANPGVHERWEQTINPAAIHQAVPHAS